MPGNPRNGKVAQLQGLAEDREVHRVRLFDEPAPPSHGDDVRQCGNPREDCADASLRNAGSEIRITSLSQRGVCQYDRHHHREQRARLIGSPCSPEPNQSDHSQHDRQPDYGDRILRNEPGSQASIGRARDSRHGKLDVQHPGSFQNSQSPRSRLDVGRGYFTIVSL